MIGAGGGYIVARMNRATRRAPLGSGDRIRELGAIVINSGRRVRDAVAERRARVNVGRTSRASCGSCDCWRGVAAARFLPTTQDIGSVADGPSIMPERRLLAAYSRRSSPHEA
jgi:hypothetical protein